MAKRLTLIGSSICGVACSFNALAQSVWVSPPIRISPTLDPNTHYSECILAASRRFSGQVAAACLRFRTAQLPDCVWAQTLDGGLSPFSIQPIPRHACVTGGTRDDPIAAASHDPARGDVYVGQTGRETGDAVSGFEVLRIPAGSALPDPAGVVAARCANGLADNPILGLGPTTDPNSHREVAYLGWPRPLCTVGSAHYNVPLIRRQFDPATPPPLNMWTGAQSQADDHPVSNDGQVHCEIPGYLGAAPKPAVITTGLAKGWLVVAWSGLQGINPPPPGSPVARAALSTNADSEPWAGLFTLPSDFLFDRDNNPIFPYSIPGDTFRISGQPSISTDPTNSLCVYVVFCGRNGESSTNSDIYVARGTINVVLGSISFINPLTQAPDVVRLSDAILEAPATPETDQVLAQIVVDQFGGINLVYLRYQGVDTNPDPLVDVYYARVTNFDNPSSGLFVHRLTPHSFSPLVGPNGDFPLYGDYIGIDTSDCFVYLDYPACYEYVADIPQPLWGWYLHRIYLVLQCAADTDASGTLETADVLAYATAYGSGHPLADRNGDGMITPEDFVVYMNQYITAGGPP